MNRRTILSVAIILLAVASVGGATMAWFTDSETVENQFTAGTLIINAEDGWRELEGDNWENANPGDCKPKDFTVTNEGSKNMYVRFSFNGAWLTPLPNAPDPIGDFVVDDELVTITPDTGDLDDWTLLDGYWYYNGVLPPGDGLTNNHILTFTFNVCLDGPDTGNEYQGASYEIEFEFEAIQITNEAVNDVWGVFWDGSAWGVAP